ncbi:MAG: NfeD family protein [Treponema sp.]|nr:NfeD family protein [Treponema sp.]
MFLLFDIGGISPHWIWLGLVILFVLIEAMTYGLTTIWFALAGVITIFLSFIPTLAFEFQALIFLGLSSIFLIFTRPLAIKKFKTGKEKTNIDSLVGKHALVIKKIAEFERGEIKLNGQIWTARTEDGSTLEEKTKCEVMRFEGVQAIVKNLSTEAKQEQIKE